MKFRHLLALPLLAAMGCQPVQRDYALYEDYPIVEGDWIEMAYSPESTEFALWAPSASECKAI